MTTPTVPALPGMTPLGFSPAEEAAFEAHEAMEMPVLETSDEASAHVANLPSLMAASFEADLAVVSITINLAYHGYDGFAVVTPADGFGPFATEAEANAFTEGLAA